MTDSDRTRQSEADRADRLAREAAALRENLKRRKAQTRARDVAPDTVPARRPIDDLAESPEEPAPK
jgi:hypothetical protein